MAVTIALVVAAYTAGEKLSFLVRVAIATLYLFACGLFYLRYEGAVVILVSLLQQLHNIGSDFEFGNIYLNRTLRSIVVVGTTILAVALIVKPNLGSAK